MPHVVVEQAGPLEVVFAALDPFVVADGNLILRISDVVLNRRGTIMLLEAVVVDQPRSQTFLIQLSQKGQAVTVRLLPATDPEEKTPAVLLPCCSTTSACRPRRSWRSPCASGP